MSRTYLPSATVELLTRNKVILATTTNSSGQFDLNPDKIVAFQLRISLSGYSTVTTRITEVNPSVSTYHLGSIGLLRRPIPQPVSKHQFLQQKFTTSKILATKGAYNLFYALNPELKEKTEVPSNYKIVYPTLPKFRPVKKRFNKRFKKDKKRDEPFIYTTKGEGHNYFQEVALGGMTNKSFYKPSGSFLADETNGQAYFAGKIKKFVFVIFKIGANGNPEILENRYKVVYYTDNVKGDESLYNKIGNATYGYAPMKASIYNVEIYDQSQQGKRVSISDDQVDPQIFFMKNDLFNSWIKIPIQVYE
jgi:hypothetical protein